MREVYICNGKRTPIGRFGGSLATVRPDDLLASVIKEIISMNMDIDIFKIDDVIIGVLIRQVRITEILLECPLYLLICL